MTVSYQLKDYSRGRASVMSLATALILWFHVDMPVAFLPAAFLKSVSDIGVDMFLLASGVGIYFAVRKYDGYRAYLSSWLRRILPAFALVSVPWYAYQVWGLGNGDPMGFLKQITALSFWLDGDWSCWFVSGILFLYLVTPPVVKALDRWKWMGAAALVGTALFALAVQHTGLIVWLGNQLIFLGRIPAYVLGLCLGRAIREERTVRIHLPLAAAVLVVSVLGMLSSWGYFSVTIPWVYRYFSYLPVMLALSLLCAKLPQRRMVTALGTVSLECYLLFEKIQTLLLGQSWMWPLMARSDCFRPLVALVLTVPAAFVLRRLCAGTRGARVDRASEKQ